jgi:hypothetical protein
LSFLRGAAAGIDPSGSDQATTLVQRRSFNFIN